VRRAVFLDRDGVLNRAVVRRGKAYPPDSIRELEILPGVRESLADLKSAGFLLLVVTNQPDVGQGHQSQRAVEAIHAHLQAELPLDDIFVCYHTDSDGCGCRKPAAGLLMQAAAQYLLDLPSCYMVGDRWRDVDAGHNAGCQSILIDYHYQEQEPQKKPISTLNSLREAADWILRCA
jgi:D-glycero-D-manno-heptose 1,7-bisphosphate phosphatase